MVTFDIDTDGRQSEAEITKVLKDMLSSGNFDGYRVSPEGFDLVKIRGMYKHAVMILSFRTDRPGQTV